MTISRKIGMCLIAATIMLSGQHVMAEPGFELKTSNNTRMLLVHQRGTVVTLQLTSGKELTGTITTVGEHLVQVSRLSGREFYDAAVRIDMIEAVIIKARTQ